MCAHACVSMCSQAGVDRHVYGHTKDMPQCTRRTEPLMVSHGLWQVHREAPGVHKWRHIVDAHDSAVSAERAAAKRRRRLDILRCQPNVLGVVVDVAERVEQLCLNRPGFEAFAVSL